MVTREFRIGATEGKCPPWTPDDIRRFTYPGSRTGDEYVRRAAGIDIAFAGTANGSAAALNN